MGNYHEEQEKKKIEDARKNLALATQELIDQSERLRATLLSDGASPSVKTAALELFNLQFLHVRGLVGDKT